MGTPSSISLHACWRARGNPADLAEGLVCFLVLHSLSRQVGAGLSTSLVRAPGRFPFMMLSYKPKSSHVTVDWVGTETRGHWDAEHSTSAHLLSEQNLVPRSQEWHRKQALDMGTGDAWGLCCALAMGWKCSPQIPVLKPSPPVTPRGDRLFRRYIRLSEVTTVGLILSGFCLPEEKKRLGHRKLGGRTRRGYSGTTAIRKPRRWPQDQPYLPIPVLWMSILYKYEKTEFLQCKPLSVWYFVLIALSIQFNSVRTIT